MLSIVGHLLLGHVLALMPWLLAQNVGRRFGIAAAWIEIALIAAYGWWWSTSLCVTPRECGRQVFATVELTYSILCLLVPFALLIGQMGSKRS
jgi:hypothetical protein